MLHSVIYNTHKKLATKTGLVMPFTCLVFTLGLVCNADDFWKDDNEDNVMLRTGWGEGEDSLGFQKPPQRNYKPVCTEDGFFLARSKLKLFSLIYFLVCSLALESSSDA